MFNTPYTVIVILIIAMALFIWGYWRYDVVAMIALAISTAVGAVPYRQVFSGFTSPAVITVACVMIISYAIGRSGSIGFLVHNLSRISKVTTFYIAGLCLVTAVLSAFMNNVGALGLMMPIAIQTALKNKKSPALVLMPIALASGLGGLITVIGTPPNLIISAFRQQISGKPFAMFDFSYVGVVVAIVGLLFLVLVGWHLIPVHKRKGAKSAEDVFEIDDYIAEVKIPKNSSFVGLTLKEFETQVKEDYLLIGIIRNKRRRVSLPNDLIIEEGDVLIIEASPQNLQKIVQKGKLEVIGSDHKGAQILSEYEIATMEAVISPNSRLEGRTSKNVHLKSRFDMNLIAISRSGNPFRERVNELTLRAGDVLLLQGPAESLAENTSTLGLLPLIERNLSIGFNSKTWLPLFIFAVAIIISSFQWIPVQLAFASSILVMLLLRAIPARTLYDGIDWSVILLLAAMIPVGQALESTGGTALIATYIDSLIPHLSALWVLVILFVVTMTLSSFMNNVATAVVMAPIGISISQSLHASIDPFLMAVAIASSCSFLTPIGHQNNTIVMGPGGYKFIDYIRLGLPLDIVVTVISIPMIIWAWPF